MTAQHIEIIITRLTVSLRLSGKHVLIVPIGTQSDDRKISPGEVTLGEAFQAIADYAKTTKLAFTP